MDRDIDQTVGHLVGQRGAGGGALGGSTGLTPTVLVTLVLTGTGLSEGRVTSSTSDGGLSSTRTKVDRCVRSRGQDPFLVMGLDGVVTVQCSQVGLPDD